MTKVNSKGEFDILFSEPVNLEKLIDFGPEKKRNLSKRSGGTQQSKKSKTQQESRKSGETSYLLSRKHLQLSITSKSDIAPKFTWKATKITSTQISIKIEFQNPLSISTSEGELD